MLNNIMLEDTSVQLLILKILLNLLLMLLPLLSVSEIDLDLWYSKSILFNRPLISDNQLSSDVGLKEILMPNSDGLAEETDHYPKEPEKTEVNSCSLQSLKTMLENTSVWPMILRAENTSKLPQPDWMFLVHLILLKLILQSKLFSKTLLPIFVVGCLETQMPD